MSARRVRPKIEIIFDEYSAVIRGPYKGTCEVSDFIEDIEDKDLPVFKENDITEDHIDSMIGYLKDRFLEIYEMKNEKTKD